MPTPPSRLAARSRWRQFRRLLAGVILALAAVVALVVVLAAVLVRDLDHPMVKRRVQALAHAKAGVDIDYGSTQIRVLSGLRITDLVVQQPARFAGLAGELAHISSVEVDWSLRALLRHQTPLSRVAIEGLRANLVRDAEGRTSLSELGQPASESPQAAAPAAPKPPTPPAPPPAPTPLSHLVGGYLAGAPPLREASVHGVALTLLLFEPHGAERLQLEAPELALHVLTGRADAGWQLHARLGSAAAPVALHLSRAHAGQPAGEATAELWLDAAVSGTDGQVGADLRVLHQTLLPTMHLGHLLQTSARVHFDQRAGRIDLALSPLTLADQAATLEANLTLPDAGPPVVHLARGTADLRPLYTTLSAEVTPIHAQRFLLNFDVAELTLTAAPRLAAGGHADVQGDIEALRIMLAGEDLHLVQGKLALKAEPTADRGTALKVELPLSGLRMVRGGAEHALAALHIGVDGHVDHLGALTGKASLRFSGLLRQSSGAGLPTERLAVRDGHLDVSATELRLEVAAPAPPSETPAPVAAPHAPTLLKHRRLAKREVHAHLQISGQLDGLDVAHPAARSEATSVGINLQAHLTGGAPYGLDLELPIQGLRLADGKGRLLHNGPAHLVVHASEIYPDAAEARHLRGDFTLNADLAGLKAQLVAHKHPTSVDFEVNTDAQSLAAVRPILAATGGVAGYELPWENMGLSLHSQGTVDQLFSPAPKLTQHSELTLNRPALKSATGELSAQGLRLVASSNGTPHRQSAELDLTVKGLKVSDQSFDDVHVTAGADLDLGVPSVRLRLNSEAKAGPQATMATTLSFDRGKKALSYDFAMQAGKLLPLQPFLAKVRAARGFDLTALELTLKGSGTVVGLIEGISPSYAPRFAPHPASTMGIAGTVELRAAGVYWNEGDRVVKSPLFGWRATLSHEDRIRKLHGELQLDALHVEFGDHELDFGKVEDSLDLAMLGDLGKGEGELTQRLQLGELQQDFVDGYVLSGLNLTLQAQRNHDGELRIGQLKLQNDGGGTEMDLTGHLELNSERRSIQLKGQLKQQLDRLWNKKETYVGHGTAELQVNVNSGNFSLFHAQAQVQVTDGNVYLPRRNITIAGFSGEVPIIMDVQADATGLHLVHGIESNVYSQLRYADQHPLLSGRSFISVGRVATPLFDVSGLAGNLRIEHTLISLSQFELGTRNGQVTGQCLLDLRDDGPTVQLRVRASHIIASHGERFDGNAALVLGVRDRSIEGRAEILRIGRRHLLDLLDLHDPHHGDASVNRIRTALSLGYPERVSLRFEHGFATAGISLGGLAGLVRIDPLRGIPMGPIVDKLLPPVQDSEDDQ